MTTPIITAIAKGEKIPDTLHFRRQQLGKDSVDMHGDIPVMLIDLHVGKTLVGRAAISATGETDSLTTADGTYHLVENEHCRLESGFVCGRVAEFVPGHIDTDDRYDILMALARLVCFSKCAGYVPGSDHSHESDAITKVTALRLDGNILGMVGKHGIDTETVVYADQAAARRVAQEEYDEILADINASGG